MKYLVLLASLLLVPGIAVSGILGDAVSLGVGASFNTPAGNFADNVAGGWGGMAGVKVGIPLFDFTGGVEYLDFSEKEFTGGNNDASMWGFTVGGRFALFTVIYAGAEIGSYSVTNTTTIGSQESKNETTYGAYGPIIGVNLIGFDFNFRYMVLESSNFSSFRLIYWF